MSAAHSEDSRSWARLVLTCDAEFLEFAQEELMQAAPAARVERELAPGVLLVEPGLSFGTLGAAWLAQPPIFVRHICPMDEEMRGDGTPADVDRLTWMAADLLDQLDPDLSFSVQTRVLDDVGYKPFDVNQRLAEAITTMRGPPLDVRNPGQVISVVATDGAIYIGVSPTALNLSSWAGGMRRFARELDQVSRAEFKLLEAIEVFGLRLPPHGVALDLGASPGGWTRVLRRHDQYVTAVDPGDLDPRLSQDKGIRHRRMTAEAYLADDPDRFDVIVNDMRMDGRDSARLMVSYARLLYPHGWALMTLKLPEQNRRPVLDHAFAILREAYTVAGARHLFHNRSEITIYLTPKRA
jgi:23S rRNA (cytidine2498-2'-O)-methyltransferase